MPRNQTARKQAEKFVSKVSDKMVEARLEELHGNQPWQAMLSADQRIRMKLLAYIRVVMELEEINREIEDIRAKHGIEASLVNIGPRGGRTLTPLQRLRRTKVNQVLRKYQSINKPAEWMVLRGVEGDPFVVEAMPRRAARSKAPTRIGRRKPAKKRAVKKSRSSPSAGRGIWVRGSVGAAPRPPRGDPHKDSDSSRDKRKKLPSITEEDLSKTIKAVEKGLKSKELPPAKRVAFQAALSTLKGWKKEWKSLLRIASNTNTFLSLWEHISKVIDFIKDLL